MSLGSQHSEAHDLIGLGVLFHCLRLGGGHDCGVGSRADDRGEVGVVEADDDGLADLHVHAFLSVDERIEAEEAEVAVHLGREVWV